MDNINTNNKSFLKKGQLLTDKYQIIKDGIQQQVGTPMEVYNKPANVFVAGFIGSPAMNFFHVILKDGKIIEQGNHESLMRQNGFYANLYNSQF